MVQTRKTTQKIIIQKELDTIDTFFTAEDLLQKIQKKHTHIGIATIYRFLNDLKNSNLLYSYTCDRRQVYSKQKKSHCHFICEKTGKTTHFEIDSLDFLKNKIPGTIKSFQLEIRGICKNDCTKCSKY